MKSFHFKAIQIKRNNVVELKENNYKPLFARCFNISNDNVLITKFIKL